MRTIISILLLAFAFNLNLSSQSNPETSALILIDIQDFYFDADKLPLEGNTEAAGVASAVLKSFRENGGMIIHIRHKGGGEIHPLVKPEKEEIVIEKVHVNAFRDTDLLSKLKDHNIENLVLAGMQTHMCLEAATRAGDDYGFQCTVIHDACATRDLEFEGKIVKAEDVHASTLNTLKSYARVMSAEEFLSERESKR